ncbi:MAG: YfcE family phosphodiesterase [Gemmataceae bacterium]|nr:YfcE family phosphodiesterase [Gemmataceae bacterium]MDW8243848.1 YfcE family phosphodiesterase [Thermogemmata sp.]
MRLLVVGDIHGNWAALEAVVTEPFDACVCVGDLVDYGPEPGPCVDWIRENALYCVRGNHDHGVAQEVVVQGVSGFRYLTAVTRPLTIAALSGQQRRYLADLPTWQMFKAGGKRYMLVHATPRDPMDEYAQPDPQFWEPRLRGLEVDYLLVGHTHQPYILQVNGTTIINPGSVGLSRDGDPRASYAIIEGETVELRRVEYPVGITLTGLEARVADRTARAMLTDIYQGGPYVQKWRAQGRYGVSAAAAAGALEPLANTNGKTSTVTPSKTD